MQDSARGSSPRHHWLRVLSHVVVSSIACQWETPAGAPGLAVGCTSLAEDSGATDRVVLPQTRFRCPGGQRGKGVAHSEMCGEP